jgi:hypothetical protein
MKSKEGVLTRRPLLWMGREYLRATHAAWAWGMGSVWLAARTMDRTSEL